MKITEFPFDLPRTAFIALTGIGLLLAPDARSQGFLPGTPVDITEALGNEVNPAITIDPLNQSVVFAVAASETAGLVTSGSANAGKAWTTNHIATGKDDLVPAYGYPSAAFDSYGNLYVAYLPAVFEGVAVAVSTNLGASFTMLTNLAAADATETPRIVAGPATAPGSVWVVYKDYSQPSAPLVTQGLLATNLGTNSQFGPPLTVPGSAGGGFPDIAVGPAGQVMVVYQNSLTNSSAATVFASLNTNAFGTNGFAQPVVVTTDAVGGLTYIPAQSTGIGVSATPGVAWDADPYSSFYGRAYVIYSALGTGNAMDIGLRYSTNNGTTWSAQKTVNDDNTGNSHFMPRVAVDPITGIVACSWYDCRNDQGSGSQPVVLTFTGSATFNDLFVTNVLVATNGIDNPTLDIVTNTTDGINFTLTISGNNLLGTIISNNSTNIVYLSTLASSFLSVTFNGNTGTNATGTNTMVTVIVRDTLPNQFTSLNAANTEPVVFTTVSLSGGATFEPNLSAISASFIIDPNALVNPPVLGFSSIEANANSPLGFGNYTGLAFYSGVFYPAWADNSDVALINPNGPLSDFDVTVSQAVVPSADLTLFVTNSPSPVLSDGVVAYSVEAINNGPSASSCVVTDVLPANVTFESAVPSVGATYSINGQTIVLNIPSILAHSSATTLILVTAGYSAYGTNIAQISGPLPDTDPANNTNTLVVLFEGEDLALAMSTSATNLYGGQVVTNMISITNLGPSANGDVTLSNLFSPNWGQLTVLSSGWTLAPNALTTGTYSTNNNALVLNVGPLSSNQSTNIVVTATALATAPAGLEVASVSSLDFDPDSANNSTNFTVEMTPQTIGAGISVPSAQVGVPLTFTIIVTNFGPSPYGFISVSNVLPPNFSTISIVQSPNPAIINGNTIIFPVGAVASNSTATLIFTAVPQSIGTVTDTFVASSFDYAPNYSNSILITATAPASPIENFHVIPAASGAFLVWDTPINATVQVDYGTTVTYGSVSSLSTPSTHHVVLLTGLLRDTNYYFEALTWEDGTLYVTNGSFATVNTLILNTQDASYSGLWTEISAGTGIFGTYYLSANTSVSDPTSSATYTPLIPVSGNYDVSIWYPESPAFATNTPVNVSGATNEIFDSVDEALNGGSWQPLAQDIYFASGVTGNVAIFNNTGVTNKTVAANGMRWVYDAAQDIPTNGTLPAWWSTFYFGTNIVNGSADADGDGYSNYAEYVFGTDPTNALSKLIFTVAPLPGNMVSVSFSPYQGGRVYQLLSSPTLDNPQWLTLTNVPSVNTNGYGVFTLQKPSPTASFYRLSATLSP
ncbi:MAG TPA: hypothetical protein VMR33_02190 [Candidatus Baltobacteraceae bacterium]|nr:hypothetical protein [Candidatus Baltobacteraceae bacterium]